jgi:hypothetical protein
MTKKKDNKDKKDIKKTPSIKVSDKLKEFDIQINSLGEIISNYDIDKINDFLNKNVEDKKLTNREDNLLEKLRKKESEEDKEDEPKNDSETE